MTATVERVEVLALIDAPLRPEAQPLPGEIATGSVLTSILWTGCLTVGLLGMVLPYARPVPPRKADVPIQAEILHVELTNDPLPPLAQHPENSLVQPPPPLPLAAPPPAAPPIVAVAEPAKVAFAIPVEGPVVVVEPAKASVAVAPVVEAPAPVAPPVRTLTFGQGEGRQPAPEYPLRARREGQEGVVTLRFTVGEDGRVLAAEASTPSPWSLLNEAALRVVRERWRFSAGRIRLFEVAIRFQLSK